MAIGVAVALYSTRNSLVAGEVSPDDFLQRWAAAWQTGDADKIMSFYDSAPETTAIESLGHVRKGPAEIQKMFEGAFDELVFDRVTWTPVVTGRHADIAWVTGRYEAEIRLKKDNRKLLLEVHGTFVMKKREDTWKIALEHFSTIPGVPRIRPAKK